jgi:hypothetical protein
MVMLECPAEKICKSHSSAVVIEPNGQHKISAGTAESERPSEESQCADNEHLRIIESQHSATTNTDQPSGHGTPTGKVLHMSYPPNPRGGVPVFITVTPAVANLAFGAMQQLTPILADANNRTVSASEPFTYSSSNPSLATVDSDGLVTAYTPDDPNALNEGGIVEVTVSYPFANCTNSDRISMISTITVQANAARTQAILRCEDTQYARPAISKWIEYQVTSANAPEPAYPPGWVITN